MVITGADKKSVKELRTQHRETLRGGMLDNKEGVKWGNWGCVGNTTGQKNGSNRVSALEN